MPRASCLEHQRFRCGCPVGSPGNCRRRQEPLVSTTAWYASCEHHLASVPRASVPHREYHHHSALLPLLSTAPPSVSSLMASLKPRARNSLLCPLPPLTPTALPSLPLLYPLPTAAPSALPSPLYYSTLTPTALPSLKQTARRPLLCHPPVELSSLMTLVTLRTGLKPSLKPGLPERPVLGAVCT